MTSAFLLAALALAAATPVPERVPLHESQRTVRFPSGNYGHVTCRDGLAVVSSGWSREDGIGVFDVSEPTNIAFVARFPAKGYSCGDPVFFGSRCYVPNGFSASVLDVSDPRAPRLEGFFNPQFPNHGCDRVWLADGELRFCGGKTFGRVERDGFSFSPVSESKPPKNHGRTWSNETLAVAIDRNVLRTSAGGKCPFVYNLASVAADGDAAYVYDPGADSTLMRLDVRTAGLRRFDGFWTVGEVPREARRYTTMGMQSAGCVARCGDLFFTDDGVLRFGADGAPVFLRRRTAAASNLSFDGTRVAIALGTTCRILDFAKPDDIRATSFAPKTDLPIHITGCALDGSRLFLAYTLVESKRQDFIYRFPTKGYVASVDLAGDTNAVSTVETPVCVALVRVGDFLYATCRGGRLALVDASAPAALRLAGVRDDFASCDLYKIKSLDGRVFLGAGSSVIELDVTNPATPQAKRVFRRGGRGETRPGYDDFTVDGQCLYALAHGSLDVFDLAAADGETVVNDFGSRGIVERTYPEADAAVFDGHVVRSSPPPGVVFEAGRYRDYFGAAVHDWTALADGRYAVAYGEAGVVICGADGRFLAELPRDRSGYVPFIARAVVLRDGVLYVRDVDGKVRRVDGLP